MKKPGRFKSIWKIQYQAEESTPEMSPTTLMIYDLEILERLHRDLWFFPTSGYFLSI